MRKLLRYFKPYMFWILLIIFFQAFRAYASLEIPGYSAEIVDVGIQTYGVESVVPKVMSEQVFTILMSGANSENNFQDYYTFISLDDEELVKKYEKKYKLTPTSNFYVLNEDIKEEDKLKLEELLAYPMALFGINNMEQNSMNGTSIMNFEGVTESQISDEVMQYVAIQGTIDVLKNAGVDIEEYQRAYVLDQGGKMLLLSFGMMLGILIAYYLSASIAVSISAKIREDLFAKVLQFSSADINKFSTSTLITRITNDLQQVNSFITMALQIAFFAPILGVVGSVKSYQNSTSMFIITISSVIFIMCIMGFVVKLAVPRFKRAQKLIDKLNLVARELINGVLVIRAFTNEKMMKKKYEAAVDNEMDNSLRIAYIMSTLMPTVFVVFNISAVAIVWFGAINASNGVMNPGDIMANIQYTGSVIFSFMMLVMLIFVLPRAQVSTGRIFEILEHDISIKTEGNEELKNIKGVVEFKNVSFKFDEKSEESALSDVSFTAKPNEITAIIGSTGSGKSTILNLLPRLYDVTSGEILIDGVNIRNLKKENLHSHIAFVPQKTTLFSGTIETNVKFADKNISNEDMIKASEIAEAMEFINDKEEKFDTPIAQGGTNVSGGQKQRLSIARAVASGRKIFVFDDSFSALDYKTDAKLRNKLKENLVDTTTIIVAQRISTIRYANQIVVLDEGKIVGVGTHNELLKTCEVYEEMALTQLPKEGLYNE